MNILMITGIFPPDIGGPATYVPQIAEGLMARGHEVTVLTFSDRKSYDDTNYPFAVVRLSRGTLKPWRWLCTVMTLIRLGRYAEVLFVNGLAMEAALANLVLRKPMVQKVVGDLAWEQARNRGWINDNFEQFQRRRYGWKVELLRALRRWWTLRADSVIVPSRYLATWVGRWGLPEERITVIYNAVVPPNGVRPIKTPLQTKTKVVTVGRLVSWKHVDRVMEATAKLEGVGLIVVGDGPELQSLERLAETLNMVDRVYFARRRSKEQTRALMAGSDLFVLNSTYEGFPHVVLEAMSLGLPVVATAVGGTPEVVRDKQNGRLIGLTDNGILHEPLFQLVSSPLERQRLAEGARYTAEQFRFSAMIEQTEALLRSAVTSQAQP